MSNVKWKEIHPDKSNTWLTQGLNRDFGSLLSLSSRSGSDGLFSLQSLGISTNRDSIAYNSSRTVLEVVAKKFFGDFNSEVDRLQRHKRPTDPRKLRAFIDGFVNYELLPWSETLKRKLTHASSAKFRSQNILLGMYRPFTARHLYLDDFMVDRPSQWGMIFPDREKEKGNRVISFSGVGSSKPFQCLASDRLVSLDFLEKTQCFPFYTYDEDGTNRRENITDWALAEFRAHYDDRKISRRDIFHYTYGLLHHPEYRTRYAANLKRELPRIPMAPEFQRFAEIGAALMKLHIEYEKQAEYPLERRETGKLDWRVVKMALSKDKTQLEYNEFLTLSGIPAEAYEYRLGNRSALEWVVDQYRVSTDKRSGIVNDPNREDDPEYIVRLVGQVVTVSLETVRLVRELAGLGIEQV